MRNTTPIDSVTEFFNAFNRKYDLPFESGPELSLNMNLITEEFEEFRRAVVDAVFSQSKTEDGKPTKEAMAHVLKELCDLLYVAYGFAVAYNLPVLEAFNRVHASNMSKLGNDGKPIHRDDGKVLKGPNYWVPNLEGLFE